MKSKIKRKVFAVLVLVIGMLSAIAMTFVYDFLVTNYGHENRFAWILGLGGGFIGLFGLVTSFILFSNNFGEGFKDEK